MGFGLAIDLLSLGKNSPFSREKLSIYRDMEALTLLTSFLVYHLIHTCNFKTETSPTIFNIGAYLTDLFCQVNPPNTAPILKSFFSHLFVYEQGDDYLFPYILKYKNNYYISPLFKDSLFYSSDILTMLTEQEFPYFFELLAVYDSMSFEWQVQHAWVFGLRSHLIKHKNKPALLVAKLSDNNTKTFSEITIPPIHVQIHNFYGHLLDTFKKYPFLDTKQQQVIHQYLTAIHTFFAS